MIHIVLPVGPIQANCSIVADEDSKEAIVVDPGGDVDDILTVLNRHDLKLTKIVLTHGHIDHVSGATPLKRLTGAPILGNPEDDFILQSVARDAAWMGIETPEVAEIDQALKHGDQVQVGKLTASIIHTPGHTPGGICLYFAEQKKLIAGDTLFMGSVGRTDFPGGSYEKLMWSLRERLMVLPDDIEVTTGHGPMTYIGVERDSNPFLQ